MQTGNLKEWVRKNATNLLRVAIVLLFLLLAFWAISLNHFNRVIVNHEPWLWLTTALVSVGPELAGIVIGVVTIDYLNKRRQDDQLKEQLILQMGSNIRDVAVSAARELAQHGWLYSNSLSGADLHGADLSGASLDLANLSQADLHGADLSEASFWGTDLSGADLMRADLSGAQFTGTNLSEASFWGADLSGASLRLVNLSGADLRAVNLSGASLMGANLSGAMHWTIEQLEQAEFLGAAIMPDGTRLGWDERWGNPRYEIYSDNIDGPSFEEWKAQFLAKQRTERAEDESISEPDNTTDGHAESGSPGPI